MFLNGEIFCHRGLLKNYNKTIKNINWKYFHFLILLLPMWAFAWKIRWAPLNLDSRPFLRRPWAPIIFRVEWIRGTVLTFGCKRKWNTRMNKMRNVWLSKYDHKESQFGALLIMQYLGCWPCKIDKHLRSNFILYFVFFSKVDITQSWQIQRRRRLDWDAMYCQARPTPCNLSSCLK